MQTEKITSFQQFLDVVWYSQYRIYRKKWPMDKLRLIFEESVEEFERRYTEETN